MAMLTPEPPMAYTVDTFANMRMRMWLRPDMLMVNLLIPFSRKLDAEVKNGVEDHDLMAYVEHAFTVFGRVTLIETGVVATTCLFIHLDTPLSRRLAYQFYVCPRLKTSYILEALQFLSAPRFVLKTALLFCPGIPASESDLAYDATVNEPAVKAVERLAVSTLVGWIAALVEQCLTGAPPKAVAEAMFFYSVRVTGATAANVVFSVVGNEVGPGTAVFLGEMARMAYGMNAAPRVEARLRAVLQRRGLLPSGGRRPQLKPEIHETYHRTN
ncbi:hypothetical protein DIPPA_33219 [Diplonema papillatum]|nr:hypothetical protein DIPPA_33219 [Diplonema papillatum]|eukprot:gene5546-8431_t